MKVVFVLSRNVNNNSNFIEVCLLVIMMVNSVVRMFIYRLMINSNLWWLMILVIVLVISVNRNIGKVVVV